MQFILVTDSKCWSTVKINNFKNCRLTLKTARPLCPHHCPSSVWQTDWASFTDPLWLDLQNRASPVWGSAPVDAQLFPPHPPWWQEEKTPFPGRSRLTVQKGKVRRRRDGWGCEWEGELVKREGGSSMRPAYLLLLLSQQYFSKPFPIFFYLHFYHRGPDVSLFCHSSVYSAACVER